MVATRQEGFVLAATIWMVAILVVLAGLFHSYVEEQVLQALALKQRVDTELDMASTAASVHYMLATRRRTLAGLTVYQEDQNVPKDESVSTLTPVGNEIRLDGALYRGVGNAFFSIQDQAGLLAVNAESTQKLLAEVLKPEVGTQQAQELAAALADYIDENENRRFNGAELLQYENTGLPGPTNWYLRSEEELFNVLGWEALLEGDTRERWRELFTIAYANALNVNTAPAPLLRMRLRLTPGEVEELIAARNSHAFRTLDGVADAVGVINVWEENEFRFFPSDSFNVKIWCSACSYFIVQSLTMTQDGFYGPWQMDYNHLAENSGERQAFETAFSVEGSVF